MKSREEVLTEEKRGGEKRNITRSQKPEKIIP